MFIIKYKLLRVKVFVHLFQKVAGLDEVQGFGSWWVWATPKALRLVVSWATPQDFELVGFDLKTWVVQNLLTLKTCA